MKKFLLRQWQRKKVWFLVALLQILLNMLSLLLGETVQKICMVTSGAVLLALSGYAVYSQRKSMVKLCLNIMLLYFNYSLVFAVYWKPNDLVPIYKGYLPGEFLRGINVLILFYLAYVAVLDEQKKENRKLFLRKSKPGTLVVAACALYIAAAPFLFYKTENFGTRGVISSFYEYALIVMIVAMRFTGRDTKHVLALLIPSGWLIVHGLLHGERILALQMIIAWGIYLMLHLLSLKLVAAGTLCGIFVFTVFGLFRGADAMDGENVLAATWKSLVSTGMANDTSYYAYLASLSIDRMKVVTPLGERLVLFLKYLVYIFAGSAVKNVHLTPLAAELNAHYGGGWLPHYANFWLGWPGSLLAGAGVAALIDRFAASKKKYRMGRYLGIYIVATSPRWYLYSPVSLTRGALFFCLFYCACVVANNVGSLILERVFAFLKKRKK